MWILRSARSMKTTKAITATTITSTPRMTTGLSAPVRPWVRNCASAAGSLGDDADEDDQRDAVADAARGDLLAEPHQEHRAADQRDDAGDAEEPARIVRQALGLEADRQAVGLEGREEHRAVAGVLVDLLAALLALLLQRLQRSAPSRPSAGR